MAAGRRNRGPRASSRFSGSRSYSSGVTVDDWRYVALSMMVFSRRLTSQPESMNSTASQSSSSRLAGTSPWDPKSSTVLTIPTPNSICQRRLTMTRAVSGLDRLAIQRASSSRSRADRGADSASAAGTPGPTRSPRMS